MTDSKHRLAAQAQAMSVLVPVHNFAHGIRQFLDTWHKSIEAAIGHAFEIVVIDDGSTDATVSILTEYVSRAPDVTFVRHDATRGLGAALRSGLAVSRHPVVLILVPDWPYRPADLRPILESLKGADMVAPYRPGSQVPAWFDRFSHLGRFLSNYVLGIEFSPSPPWHGWADYRRRVGWRWRFGVRSQDPTCGIRLVRRWVLDRCPIQSNGAFALVEMYAKANFAGAMEAELALGKPGITPVMHEPFADQPSDARSVFRTPDFRPAPIEMATTTLDTSARLAT